MNQSIRIAPSILSADFARLGDDVQAAEAAGADVIHVDVMDGVFVPNITIGPLVVAAVRRMTTLPIDVHLMIDRPERYLSAFAEAGADFLSVHPEATIHLHRTLQQIRDLHVHPGVVLNPATPESVLKYAMPYVDLVLVMTVNPGFGGQSLIPEMMEKISAVRAMIDAMERSVWLSVDGGIDVETAPEVVKRGANHLVAGSAIFSAPEGIAQAIAGLRQAAGNVGGSN
jgi:ribulose-phosphate 3-epimerase